MASNNGKATPPGLERTSQIPVCSNKPLWWREANVGKSCEPSPSGHHSPKTETVGEGEGPRARKWETGMSNLIPQGTGI